MSNEQNDAASQPGEVRSSEGLGRTLVERLRNYGLDLACHPVANGTIDCTERSGEMLLDAAAEIERLRDWIRAEAEQHDTCTRNVLGDVCGGCRCGKRGRNED